MLRLALLLIAFSGITWQAEAQSEVISSAKSAIKTGNSKDLTKYLNNLVEIKIEDEANASSNNYSKTHAEFVLKNFFKDNPPQGFEYIHEGTSKEGLKYTIGKYTYKDRNNKACSFRVFMKLKQYGDYYLIDAIDFSKDEEQN